MGSCVRKAEAASNRKTSTENIHSTKEQRLKIIFVKKTDWKDRELIFKQKDARVPELCLSMSNLYSRRMAKLSKNNL